MRKQYFVDNYGNVNIKVTFYEYDSDTLGAIGLNYDWDMFPDDGLTLHVAINSKIFKSAIMAMINHREAVREVIMFADMTNCQIGEPVSLSLRRSDDAEIVMIYNCIAVDEEGGRFAHSFNMREFLPYDVIDFLQELKD